MERIPEGSSCSGSLGLLVTLALMLWLCATPINHVVKLQEKRQNMLVRHDDNMKHMKSEKSI